MLPDAPQSDAGLIDLHCHLLPGIDDGCRTMRESIECVRRWMSAGFVGAACTPHVGPSWYPENTPDLLAQGLDKFRQALTEASLEFQLWDGGEVRISPDVIDWFSLWGLPTLGPGRCVLLDWWETDWPAFCDETCQYLLENGYQPILAHPERMGLSDGNWDKVLERLQQSGVWLQGNLNSLCGGEGVRAQQRALELLHGDRYYLLATDTHRPDSILGRREGLQWLQDEAGEDRLAYLLDRRPREVLLHLAV